MPQAYLPDITLCNTTDILPEWLVKAWRGKWRKLHYAIGMHGNV